MKKAIQEDFSIAEEAVEWLVRLSEDDSTASRSAFCAWFRQSPRHVQAFLEASETNRALSALDRNRDIDVESLIAEVATNVVTLSGGEARSSGIDPPVPGIKPRAIRRRWAVVGTAAAAIIALTVALGFWPGNHVSVGTKIGEQRTLKLKDGSLVTLNARSRIEVIFSDERRDIRLVEGEASFVVAQDPMRPFQVFTDEATARALGTEFDVQRRAHGTVVSVREGIVQVSAGTASSHAGVRLSAGEEAQITSQGKISSRKLPDPRKVAIWRERRLEFHDVALAEVAAEFNRYNELKIRIEGSVDETKAISGIFSADDPQALIQFLQRDPSLQVEHMDTFIVVHENRN